MRVQKLNAKYFKVMRMYLYMRERLNAATNYMNTHHSNIDITDSKAYGEALVSFYENYPKFK